ncbi:MAG: heparan-alpha-glucosaminide N-acetyltransferase domain-containing protein [Bacteroidota bacterium]|nr:heparan-alpha-glucosaminide N-acetyltransferase domain-containing protein [Bacteroidota bacterium]
MTKQAAIVPNSRGRIQSIDVLRGLVMVIMALDHVRDFFHNQAMTDEPTNMATTTPWLFFTRWITHFCAPVFIFLAGTSSFLMGQKKTRKELSRFLVTRGLWLLFIELFIITFAWTFNPFYNFFILQVIWAISLSMIVLGLLVRLPFPVILAFGLLVVLGHNLLDYPEAANKGHVGFWWNLLHHAQFDTYEIWKGHFAVLIYAFVPWSGIMALGYCFGAWFKKEVPGETRRKRLLFLGAGMIALFIILRLINKYGDPAPWSQQPRGAVITLLSFFNVTKYPPSLMYACITLGPAILFLALIEKVQSKWENFFLVYGRVPFFYYVLHFYIIHLFCVIAFFAKGYTTSQIVTPQFPFYFRPPTFGFDLWVVYAIWIIVVISLYPLCRWYNRYKATHHQWWLSYL